MCDAKGDDEPELVPFWCLPGGGSVKIERIIPMYPYSKDKAIYSRLLEILSLYRVTMGQARQQIVQGWIDLLLDTPAGYVIIDHKDYPGKDVIDRMKKYVPQLRTYKEIVEKATGKPVIDTLLHLPISGLVIRILSCKKI